MSLIRLAKLSRELGARADVNPLEYFRPTPPQLEYLKDASPVTLLRGGNQAGKTISAVVDCHYRCLGIHPYLSTHKPPIEAWIITHSWEQSIAVQQKFWEMAPKEEIHPDTEFVPGRGFRGKVPVVRYRNGSLVRIKTTNQGSLGLASATIEAVYIDEPPPPNIWGELQARVLRKGGVIKLSLTPVGAPLEWLKKLVEDGIVSEHQCALTVENCTPIGGSPLITQHQIDTIALSYLPMDRDQRLHGAWDGMVEGRVFMAFDDDKMVSSEPLPTLAPSDKPFEIAIGMDHGSDAGSQVAILAAVWKQGKFPKVWVLDEYSAGASPPEVHARAITNMLKRNGMTWHNVDKWVGDRAYGGRKSGGRMSNSMLMRGFEVALGYSRGRCPFKIRTAWKPRHSVYWSSNVLHEVMERGNFVIRPQCKQLIRSLQNWQFKDDEFKHSIDALRYGAVTLIADKFKSPVKVKMY